MTSFHEHDRLARLLRSWARDGDVDELVLAGDVFDFLQVPGYDGFSVEHAGSRFERITDHAPTASVLTALRELASQPGLDLTVLSGNHDPELLLPEVRAALEERVGRRGSVRWADDAPLVTGDRDRLPLWGRAVCAPGAEAELGQQVWIVHGDRWDPQNVFDRDEIKRCAQTGAPVKLPPGSHLVFEVLSQIIHSEQRRWVAELKPDAAAGLVLFAIGRVQFLGYVRRHFRVAERMLAAKLKQLVHSGPTLDGTTAAAPPDTVSFPDELLACLADQLATAGTVQREILLAGFEPFLLDGEPPATEAVLGGTSVRDLLLRSACKTSSGARFNDRAGEDDIPGHAARVVPANLGALVAGHTHAPRVRAELTPRYFNSGTWMPVRTLDGDLARLQRLLEEPYQPVPSPGTYVRIELGEGPPRVAVEEAPL